MDNEITTGMCVCNLSPFVGRKVLTSVLAAFVSSGKSSDYIVHVNLGFVGP